MSANGGVTKISGFDAIYVAKIVLKNFKSDHIGGIYTKFIAKCFGKV